MKILISAGAVYGRLDDNKLVSNRSRGIWAEKFAEYLCNAGHQVTLLVADTYRIDSQSGGRVQGDWRDNLIVGRHKGFDEYLSLCQIMAPDMDAAVMASAVVNWIPAEPIRGKMLTKGYKAGDRIDIPFYLAPHVIDEMRKINPKLTLIGCKMLSKASHEELITAAYDVVLRAKCNVVVANDLSDLHKKFLVYQDRVVRPHHTNNVGDFYDELYQVLQDTHYHTIMQRVGSAFIGTPEGFEPTFDVFEKIRLKYKDRFTHRVAGEDKVFGAICNPIPLDLGTTYQLSPREKGAAFTSADSVEVLYVDKTNVGVNGISKATLNAPLLIRVAKAYGNRPVLHLHEQLPGYPTVPYAPPGTVRDNDRDIPGPVFNIEGHGFIACLDDKLEILPHE